MGHYSYLIFARRLPSGNYASRACGGWDVDANNPVAARTRRRSVRVARSLWRQCLSRNSHQIHSSLLFGATTAREKTVSGAASAPDVEPADVESARATYERARVRRGRREGPRRDASGANPRPVIPNLYFSMLVKGRATPARDWCQKFCRHRKATGGFKGTRRAHAAGGWTASVSTRRRQRRRSLGGAPRARARG